MPEEILPPQETNTDLGLGPDEPKSTSPPAVIDNSGDHISKSMEAVFNKVQSEQPTQRLPSESLLYSRDNEAPAEQPAEIETPQPERPQAWGKAIEASWDKLPADVQSEILKREADVQRFVTSRGQILKQAEATTQAFESVLSRHADAIPKLQDGRDMPVPQVLDSLLTAHRLLESNPREALQWLANGYGVNLAELQPPDPAEQYRQQEQAQRQQYQRQLAEQQQEVHQQQQAAQVAQLTNQIEQATASIPHWNSVEGEVLQHVTALKSDPMQLLGVAYEMAMRAHPDLDANTQQRAAQERAERIARADQAKRAASINVRSIHSGASPKATAKDISTAANMAAYMSEIYHQSGGR